MQDFISGIQQVGIGVKDATASMYRYAKVFGMDTLVFNDVSDAYLMTRYTGNTVYKRHAILSLNMQGGGGFEIWQFKDRTPVEPLHQLCYGDIGIYSPKIKCRNIKTAHTTLSAINNLTVSDIHIDVIGKNHFWVRDEFANVFNIVECHYWFQEKKILGGVTGAVIGVTDIDRSKGFLSVSIKYRYGGLR
jgi:hypothetical protein